MEKHDNYEYWKACRKAQKANEAEGRAEHVMPDPSTDTVPLGFFKQGNGTPVAIWVDPADKQIIVRVGVEKTAKQMKPERIESLLEYGGFGEAVGEKDYMKAYADGAWPWNEPAIPGGNAPPAEGTAEDIEAKLKELTEKITAQTASPVREKAVADSLQNLRDMATRHKTFVIEKHKEEKKPHLDAGRAVDNKWFGLRDSLADIASKAERGLNGYLSWAQAEANRKAQEEEKRLRDERAKEIAAAPAEERAELEQEPAPTVEPERVRVGNTRKTSLKKEKVAKIVDLEKAIKAILASNSNSWTASLEEVVQKIANGAMRAGINIDGVEVIEETKAS